MNLTTDETLNLLDAKNAAEWNKLCDRIKKIRDGQYPPDWYEVVLAGGLMGSVSANWKKESQGK